MANPITEANTPGATTRQNLSKMLQLHGYSACREALVLLEDHYNSSNVYASLEDFISLLNRTVVLDVKANTSIIDPDLAYTIIQKLTNSHRSSNEGHQTQESSSIQAEEPPVIVPPDDLIVKVKNVQYDWIDHKTSSEKAKPTDELNIHYNFLFKRLNTLPIFQGDFQLTKLSTLTASNQPSIRCICFGLIIKDVSKIDGYMLIDSTGRVPVRITPDTTFRNKLAYSNCIVLIEGVYVNPDDILWAANIGLPPILLDPLTDKALCCSKEKLVVILKELYLDDQDVCEALDLLFTGYNSMEDPPILFILIGDFTREKHGIDSYKFHMKKLIRILRACENLKNCNFVFIPGNNDSGFINDEINFGINSPISSMPKPPLSKERIPIDLLRMSNFNNIHLATNPAHIYLDDRLITVVGHSYFKELQKNLLHDLSDHRHEFFEACKQIILSNAHLAAGITKIYHSSMNLWHKPDLLVIADTEAFGNRYDYSSSSGSDTSFATIPSFSRQSNQFRVYYVNTGEIEESQVSSDAYRLALND